MSNKVYNIFYRKNKDVYTDIILAENFDEAVKKSKEKYGDNLYQVGKIIITKIYDQSTREIHA